MQMDGVAFIHENHKGAVEDDGHQPRSSTNYQIRKLTDTDR